jgi:sialate O-acetylesterase
MKLSFIVLFQLLCLNQAFAQKLWVPNVFSSHMVLQREIPVPVWGKAKSGAEVRVLLKKAYKATADKDGNWKIFLEPMKAGGPFHLRVFSGKESIKFEDVLIGDVFFGAGQSNLQFDLKSSENGEKEVLQAKFPKIRLLKVPNEVSYKPEADQEGKWELCTPASAKASQRFNITLENRFTWRKTYPLA